MYCPNCGTYNENGSRFCGSCGAELIQTAGSTSNEWNANANSNINYNANYNYNPNYNYNANYQRINGKLYTVISAICIAFGFIWGIIALSNALQINKLQDAGDFESAMKKAKTCRIMWIIAVVINVLAMIGYLAQNGAI